MDKISDEPHEVSRSLCPVSTRWNEQQLCTLMHCCTWKSFPAFNRMNFLARFMSFERFSCFRSIWNYHYGDAFIFCRLAKSVSFAKLRRSAGKFGKLLSCLYFTGVLTLEIRCNFHFPVIFRWKTFKSQDHGQIFFCSKNNFSSIFQAVTR